MEKESYLDRLFKERDELGVKVSKLKGALAAGNIPEEAIEINRKQLHPMEYYLETINTKIGISVSKEDLI